MTKQNDKTELELQQTALEATTLDRTVADTPTDPTELEQTKTEFQFFAPTVIETEPTALDDETQLELLNTTQLEITDKTVVEQSGGTVLEQAHTVLEQPDKTVLDLTQLDQEPLTRLRKAKFGYHKKDTQNLVYSPNTTPLREVGRYVLNALPLNRKNQRQQQTEISKASNSYYKVLVTCGVIWAVCVVGLVILAQF